MMGHCHLVRVYVYREPIVPPFSVCIYLPLNILGAATTAAALTVQYDFSFSKIIIVK